MLEPKPFAKLFGAFFDWHFFQPPFVTSQTKCSSSDFPLLQDDTHVVYTALPLLPPLLSPLEVFTTRPINARKDRRSFVHYSSLVYS